MSWGGYGGGPPPAGYGPPRTTRLSAGFVVTLGLLAVAGGAVDALFSFGMLFATDSCGTGSSSDPVVCHVTVWAILLALPWIGLLAAVLMALLGGLWATRRQRSPWPALAAGATVYLAVGAITCLVLFH